MVTLLESPPFERQRGHGVWLDSFRCTSKNADGSDCKRVEFTYDKMIRHIAVEHGIRPVRKD